jgi:hypothetical protein
LITSTHQKPRRPAAKGGQAYQGPADASQGQSLVLVAPGEDAILSIVSFVPGAHRIVARPSSFLHETVAKLH